MKKNILIIGLCDISHMKKYFSYFKDNYNLYYIGTVGSPITSSIFSIDWTIHYDYIFISQLSNITSNVVQELIKKLKDTQIYVYSWEYTSSYWSDKTSFIKTTNTINTLVNAYDICQKLNINIINFESFKERLEYPENYIYGIHFPDKVYEKLILLFLDIINNKIDKNSLNDNTTAIHVRRGDIARMPDTHPWKKVYTPSNN